MGKRRVAILGSGVGGTFTALALTDPDNPAAKDLEVTIYQQGWRIGGKGASGRSAAHGYRIEEHGLHIWMGFYDNAFRWLGRVYAERDRPADAPLARIEQAFQAHTSIVDTSRVRRQYRRVSVKLPVNACPPGRGTLVPFWQYLWMAFLGTLAAFGLWAAPRENVHGRVALPAESAVGKALAPHTQRWQIRLLNGLLGACQAFPPLSWPFQILSYVLLAPLGLLLWAWVALRRQHIVEDDAAWSRWQFLSFFWANLWGTTRENVLARGTRGLDGMDYHAWLSKYAIPDGGLMVDGPMVRGLYDASFAYLGGDLAQGPGWPATAQMSAAVTLAAVLRSLPAMKGAPMYRMSAGMGDVVFAPAYEVLRRRGVRFEFFHQVTDVVAGDDAVERVELRRQVELVNPEAPYDPLIQVRSVPCWPSEPRWDQLRDGARLRAEQVNFEALVPSVPGTPVTLRRGVDFDDVVLAISVGGIATAAPSLVAASPSWQALVAGLPTIRTQAAQLWMRRTSSQLGVRPGGEPVASGYEACPMDTFADMSFLLPAEAWPVDATVLHITYLVGVATDPPVPPVLDAAAQRQANAETLALTERFLRTHGSYYYPDGVVVHDGHPTPAFDVSLLWAPAADSPPLAQQYFRQNLMPSERYVLSPPSTLALRPSARDPKWRNLYLAGDWTRCVWNAGCVEGAATSALLASNAMTAYPPVDEVLGLRLDGYWDAPDAQGGPR